MVDSAERGVTMKPKTSRAIAIAAIIVIAVVTLISCQMLPREPLPEADVPNAHARVAGSDDETTLTLGRYSWSYTANGQNYGETLLQIGPQAWNVDELAHVSAASTARVTVTFDEAPLTTYVQSWDEKDLSKEDLVGKPLAWRARYWRDFVNTLGEEVPSTFEDNVLAFDVTPGRRYAISTRFGPDPSEGDRVEYVFTVS